MSLGCQWGELRNQSCSERNYLPLVSHESNGCALHACCPDVVGSCPELGLWKLKSPLEPAVGHGRMPLEFYRCDLK
jgi:hypothetical protein